MRSAFNRLTIRQKLLFIITLTSAIALFLAFAAFSATSIAVFNENQKSRQLILAQILADNSEAAVSFNDKKTAEELLGALQAEENISEAVIYAQEGEEFAKYTPGQSVSSEPAPAVRSQFYKNQHLHTYWPIVLDHKTIGMVYLKTGLHDLVALIVRYVLFGLLILIACIAAAWAVAARLQQSISSPITRLAQLAEQVSKEKNYSLRAEKTSTDEIGNLMDRFNEMLSEIQRREEALIRSNEAILQSNRELEQFAYVASHDLQEPLRMVINYTELVEMRLRGKVDPDTQQFMSFVSEGASRSRHLIDDLLQYSRVRGESKLQHISAEEALQRALANLRFAIEESGAEITHDPLPTLYADPVKLTQVFQNLIGNALKFRRGTPQIQIRVKKTGSDWVFSVKDNGIGIDSVYLERVFVMFKRLHSRETYPGTGIGLAICKRIIEQHGGEIWVESVKNQGSTFYFTIPIQGGETNDAS